MQITHKLVNPHLHPPNILRNPPDDGPYKHSKNAKQLQNGEKKQQAGSGKQMRRAATPNNTIQIESAAADEV